MRTRAGTTILAALLSLAWAPVGEPTFSNPTNIDNPYARFEPGSVKVFRGRSEGVRTTTLVTHLEQTRVFEYGGGPVECRILEEKDFESGALVEIAYNYLAQDDEGNVRFFGEVSWIVEGGLVTDFEQDSWLVGGATLPGDPEGVIDAPAPTTYMIANPKVGDVFYQEDFGGATESLTVVATDVNVKVPAGKFAIAIKLREDDGEDTTGDGPQYHWVVPGMGVVREKDKDGSAHLLATSLLADLDAR